jgi:hypothetical protein
MDLFDRIRQNSQELPRLDSPAINALKKRHPDLPADYLRFLEEVGYGDLGELQLYNGPSAFENFYPIISGSAPNVLIFGDDKQGYCFGFDLADSYRVVEISPRGNVAKEIEASFSGLLKSYFG